MKGYDYRAERELAKRLKDPLALEEYERLQIGFSIKKLRKKARFSQKDLAKHLHTSQSAVCRMEAGKQNFSLRILFKIAVTLKGKVRVSLT